jgi:acetyltransferase-like isoleucine patch superfamily enzyme
MKVAIFGVGALASIIYQSVCDVGDEVICFISDEPTSERFLGLPHYCFEDFIKLNLYKSTHVFVAVGPSSINQGRSKVMKRFKNIGCKFYSYRSPLSRFSGKLMDNVFIGDFVSIGQAVKIGSGTFIWENVVISHDVNIKEFVYISPGACIGAYATIEDHSLLGMGSIVKPKIKIASKTLVGAGAYISEDTIINGVYAPARNLFLGQVSEKINISK